MKWRPLRSPFTLMDSTRRDSTRYRDVRPSSAIACPILTSAPSDGDRRTVDTVSLSDTLSPSEQQSGRSPTGWGRKQQRMDLVSVTTDGYGLTVGFQRTEQRRLLDQISQLNCIFDDDAWCACGLVITTCQ